MTKADKILFDAVLSLFNRVNKGKVYIRRRNTPFSGLRINYNNNRHHKYGMTHHFELMRNNYEMPQTECVAVFDCALAISAASALLLWDIPYYSTEYTQVVRGVKLRARLVSFNTISVRDCLSLPTQDLNRANERSDQAKKLLEYFSKLK
ncbi:MAG: hypothetical protein CUN56_00015 [Phototrophicales bacterium]|nr:MAG: hypothetical protein CUN56_00015 [Phototrophicales bacterium]